MGTEYYMFNHSNATFYELGRGPWYILDDLKWTLHDSEIFAEVLEHEWDSFEDPNKTWYFKLLARDLERFVKNSKESDLTIHGDSGDELMQAQMLGYRCTGSRYELADPKKNQEYIDDENRRTGTWHFSDLSDHERSELRTLGWNFKNAI